MIKLAFQVPFAYLHHHFGDMDFALADFVLKHEGYRDYYAQSNRDMILDNSLHELGSSLALNKLEEAFYSIEPRWVIPPDVLFKTKETLRNLEIAEHVFPEGQILPVLQATTIADFLYLQEAYLEKGYKYMCVPYRMSRMSLLPFLRSDIKYHFLGLICAEEFSFLAKQPNIVSLDTGKPFRKGEHKLDMNSNDLDLDYINQTIQDYKNRYLASPTDRTLIRKG